MLVDVCHRHIEGGKIHDEHACPVALAICEKLNITANRVVVKAYFTLIYYDDSWLTYWHCEETALLIKKYDQTGIMEPFIARFSRTRSIS